MTDAPTEKSSARKRADAIKAFRCKHLIAVIESPLEVRNVGTVIRNVNALGVEKAYVVDRKGILPDDWAEMREQKALSKTSVSAVKWSFVRTFDSTADCLAHLASKNFRSVVTSPHVKGKRNEAFDDVDYTVFPKLAVWFGSESVGISDEAVGAAEMCISIPMHGMVDSLNLGTSSGIVLYEIAKQRRRYQSLYRKRNRKSPILPDLPT